MMTSSARPTNTDSRPRHDGAIASRYQSPRRLSAVSSDSSSTRGRATAAARERQIADVADGGFVAVLVDHAEVVPGNGFPIEPARIGRHGSSRPDGALGLAVPSWIRAKRSCQVGSLPVQRLAGADAVAEPRQRHLDKSCFTRMRYSVGGAQTTTPRTARAGRARAAGRSGRRTQQARRSSRAVEHAPTRPSPSRCRTSSSGVRAAEVEPVLARPAVRERVAVRVQHGFGSFVGPDV